jgi:hypothetical protein
VTYDPAAPGKDDLSAADPGQKTDSHTPHFEGGGYGVVGRGGADQQLQQGRQADYTQSTTDGQGRFGTTDVPGNATDASSLGMSGSGDQQGSASQERQQGELQGTSGCAVSMILRSQSDRRRPSACWYGHAARV